MISRKAGRWLRSCLFLLWIPLLLPAQNEPFGLGTWRAYLPAGDYIALEAGEESLITANFYQLVLYYPETGEQLVLNKANGLSQTGISAVKFWKERGSIIVGYENGNVDVVTPDRTINIPGIRNNENILGARRINAIEIGEEMLYLATEFGIVSIDGATYEFSATLFTEDPILKIAWMPQTRQLIASSESEIFTLETDRNTNLSDISQWNILPPEFPGSVGDIAVWENALYLVVSGDLYQMQEDGSMTTVPASKAKVSHIRNGGERLLVINEFSNIISWDGEKSDQKANPCLSGLRGVVRRGNNEFWFVTKNDFGRFGSGGCEPVELAGVPSRYVSKMAVLDGDLFVATGGVTRIFGYLFREDGFYTNAGGGWTVFNNKTDEQLKARNMRDVYSAAVDPAAEKVYMGTFWDGLIEYDKGKIKIFDAANSTIQPSQLNPERTRITDIFLDEKENLWLANHDAPRPVVVKTRDGDWHSFRIPQKSDVERLVVDEWENIWMDIGELGLLIYRPNDWDRDGDDESRLIIPKSGSGDGTAFDNARINEIAIDREGAVWVCTESGPVVFDCGDFALDEMCQGRKPVIEIDGRLGVLLQKENVKAIAIDPANRKWLGTTNGVYVVNSSVTGIDHHFTAENSPLPHNSISDIAIDPVSGEVFIATDEGLVSYRGEAVESLTGASSSVTVYPNPVPPEYSGQVGIRELPENALVRITTLSGRQVFEKRALGGQVVWDQRDQDGRKLGSGVYLIYATKDDSFSPYTLTGKVFLLH